MDDSNLGVSISQLENERFGIQVARATIAMETFNSMLDHCHDRSVQLLIARCPVSEMMLVHQLENHGFLLMDTLVYYSRDLVNKPVPDVQNMIVVRPVKPGEEQSVKKLAEEAFTGYKGHYHCDDRLDKKLCDEIYPDWAYRSCISKDVADEVLVAEQNSSILGFITLRMNSRNETEGVLNGVLPVAQRRGIYTSLVVHGIMWSVRQGAEAMLISTQITNKTPQKIWNRLGFEFSHAYYTFHKWFEQ